MTGPIFDTHAHYSARAFDADRFALLDSLPDKGVVGVCEQATHSGDAPRVLELAHRYPWVVAAVGIHPESLLPAADCGEDGPAPTVSVYSGDWAAEMQALMPLKGWNYYDTISVKFSHQVVATRRNKALAATFDWASINDEPDADIETMTTSTTSGLPSAPSSS